MISSSTISASKLTQLFIFFSMNEEEFAVMQQEQGLLVEYMQSVRILDQMIQNVS